MFQNIPADKVLDVVKQGPTVPAKVAKVVGGDTMIVGAILSTLISQGTVKVSTMKMGGSPLYYIPEQEDKLEQFTSLLNEKDRRTFQLLKDKKVLGDSEQDPLIRVSLRAIKDFAKQFEFEYGGKKEICWRYFLVPKEEALGILDSLASERKDRQSAEIKETERKEAYIEPTPIEISIGKPKAHEEHTKIVAAHAEYTEKTSKEDFLSSIKTYLLSRKLDIITAEKIKKSEYSLVLKNHDTNEYIYCKAKDKKSINDGDLASAYVFAQNKKMTCMFLTSGILTKKASSIVGKEFPGMIIEHMK